jgi:hypothetical protein
MVITPMLSCITGLNGLRAGISRSCNGHGAVEFVSMLRENATCIGAYPKLRMAARIALNCMMKLEVLLD